MKRRSLHDAKDPESRAVLVGVQLPGVSDLERDASLDELERLARTLGLQVVARVTQARPGTGAPAVLGAGKLAELARWTGGTGVVPAGASNRQKGARPAEDDHDGDDGDDAELDDAELEELEDLEDLAELDELEDPEHLDEPADASSGGDAAARELAEPPLDEALRAAVVVFDHDLSPSQLRNLEGATSAEVLDRSSVILNIFQRHARTREARLQVEIARLRYLAPRLRAAGAGGDRQRGGIGGKGAGESSLELDRRRVRDRIAELKSSLVAVQREAQTRHQRRQRADTVALVGYTNAGKSSLMRRLTASDVVVRDQLFATLDTTVRLLQPRTSPALFVCDTVGFIKKLPHDLVASFRSTLEEARGATLLLHVLDASDPSWRSHYQVTHDVLGEIGAGDVPVIVALNKADRLDAAALSALAGEMPEALIMSAHRAADIETLHGRVVAFFERDMVEQDLFVSYSEPRMVHTIHEACRVLSTIHEDNGTRLRVRAPRELVDELQAGLRGPR